MKTFVDALAPWQGIASIERELSQRGVSVPAGLRTRFASEFGAAEADAIDQYWEEASHERYSAGGRCNPDLRKFFLQFETYRSRYLDDLRLTYGAIEFLVVDGKRQYLEPLVEKAMEWRPSQTRAVRSSISLEALSNPFVNHLDLPSALGDKNDVAKCISLAARAQGFRRNNQRKGVWEKLLRDEVLVRVIFDQGLTASWNFNIGASVELAHIEKPEEIVYGSPPLPIVPNFHIYSYFDGSPIGCVHGAFAYFAYSDVIWGI